MTDKNFYDVLGVSRQASDADIKKAYRKLVRQYHPDVSKEPDADLKTVEINQAYEVLKDKEKRAEYNRQLDNPFAGQPRAGGGGQRQGYYQQFDRANFGQGQPFGEGDFRFEDLFSAFGGAAEAQQGGFGRTQSSAPMQGEDQHAELTIDLAAAYQGDSRSLTINMPTITADGHMTYEQKTLNVKIPKGIREGQQIRLAGQGLPSFNGGKAGDLFLRVRFAEQSGLRVEGKDVYQQVAIMPWEAALGGKITVTTPAGKLSVSIPKHSNTGKTLRLSGKGIPASKPGNLMLELVITLPTATSDATDEQVWSTLAEHFADYKPHR